MTRPSKHPHVGVGALRLQTPATQLIRELDTPEKCAEFWVDAQEPYAAVGEVMRHAKSLLMLGARERPIPVGEKFVAVEPSDYTYDLETVKELALDCIKTVEVPTTERMQHINELAQKIYEDELAPGGCSQVTMDAIAEIMKLSQAETVEQVDGNKLRAVLGRGDARAMELMSRKVKRPSAWKLVIKEGASANR